MSEPAVRLLLAGAARDVLRDAIGAGRCSRPLIRRLLRVRGADLPSSVPAAVFEQPDADPVYFEALAAFIEGSAA